MSAEVRVPGTLDGEELSLTLWRNAKTDQVVVRFRILTGNPEMDPFGEVDVDVRELNPLITALWTASEQGDIG